MGVVGLGEGTGVGKSLGKSPGKEFQRRKHERKGPTTRKSPWARGTDRRKESVGARGRPPERVRGKSPRGDRPPERVLKGSLHFVHKQKTKVNQRVYKEFFLVYYGL